MNEIISFLSAIGFECSISSDNSFTANYQKENGIQLIVIYLADKLGIQADYKGLTRIIISSSVILSPSDLIFFLERNVFFKSEFPEIIKEFPQDQI